MARQKKHGTCTIIAIGDELLLGEIQDSNSSFLAQRVSQYGFHVKAMQIIGDEEDRIVAALLEACQEVDLVLVTGGLGPTEDDRTRHALARVTGTVLRENKAAWKQITKFIHKSWPGRAIAESNKRQALIPRGVKVVKNDRGTAPGMLAHKQETHILCMPGVPHEMKAMAERFFAQMDDLFPNIDVPVLEEIHFAGLGESRAQDLLGDLLSGTRPQVGICAHEDGHITIRVRGSTSAVKKRCSQIRKLIREYLLPDSGLAQSLVSELTARKKIVTTAESCTCGLIVSALGAIPGASSILEEGLIAYHERIKSERLDVDPHLIEKYGVVSEEVAVAMAEGALQRSEADYAVATTGIAGPDGGSKENPVGTVWVAVASRDHLITQRLSIRGDRHRVQRRAAAESLRFLWSLLVDER